MSSLISDRKLVWAFYINWLPSGLLFIAEGF